LDPLQIELTVQKLPDEEAAGGGEHCEGGDADADQTSRDHQGRTEH
jgi:hypothetical protein